MGAPCSRRRFLGLAATAPLAVTAGCGGGSSEPSPSPTVNPTAPPSGSSGVVAITGAHGYGSEAAAAIRQALDLLGGIGSLVRGKTVTVKVNFTGWPIQAVGGRKRAAHYPEEASQRPERIPQSDRGLVGNGPASPAG